MIYVFENYGNKASIVYDETTITEEEKSDGIGLEKLPEPEIIEGKTEILKCNKITKEVWYDYEEIQAEPAEGLVTDDE